MDDSELDEQRHFDAGERELTKARQAQLAAEEKVLALESLVETLERQRDKADSLLSRLLAVALDASMPTDSKPYTETRAYLEEIAGLDKYERRLM